MVWGGDRSAAAQECHTTIGFPVTAFLDETGEGAVVQGLIVTMVTVTDSLRERWKMMIWLPSSRTSASDDSKKQKKADASTVRRLFKPEYYIHSPVHTLTHIWLLQVSQQCLANHDQIIPELLHQNHQKPRLHKDTKQPSLAKKYQNPSNNKWCILTTVWPKTSARYTDRDTNNHKWCLPASWLFCVFREFLHVCADPGNLVLTDPRCALETMRQYNSHP